MKTMKCMMIAVLLAGIFLSATATNPNQVTKIKSPFININVRETMLPVPALSSAAFDKCRKYKSKQVAGFVLVPVSLGMMAGGGYLIYLGVKNIYDNTEVALEGISTKVEQQDKVFLGVGSGLVFAGAVLFPTGLVLGIKGGTNYNRDCRGGTTPNRSLYIRPTGNGINLALRF